MGWQGTETHYAGISRTVPGPLHKGVVWLGDIIRGNSLGRGLAVRTFNAFPVSPAVKADTWSRTLLLILIPEPRRGNA